MDPLKKREMVQGLKSLLIFFEAMPEQHSCGTCEHWLAGKCSLAAAVPPADVQAEGCELWKLTECPF